MHHIQRDIIALLARTSPLRFSEIQPKHIPNNTFSYHLKKLLQLGYVESTEGGYIATRKALKTIPFTNPHTQRILRPATISMLYVTNSSDQVLVIRRNQRPFNGWYGVPSGLIHSYETLESAAQRELKEKTGIYAPTAKLQPHGVLDFRYLEATSQDVFVHAIAFVYSYKYTGPADIISLAEPRSATLEWQSLDHPNILPEVKEAADMVRIGSSIRSVNFDEPTA